MISFKKRIFITISLLICSALAIIISKIYYHLPDANDIYTTYFNTYQLPDKQKSEVMAELKMMVNYITYEKATGKDYIKEIQFLQNWAKQQMAGTIFQKEISDFQQSSLDSNNLKEFPHKTIDESHFCTDFSSFLTEQREMVQTFHLPYLLENSVLQFIDIHQGTLAKESIDITSHNTPSFKSDNEKGLYKKLRDFPWQTADVLLAHQSTGKSNSSSIQGYYNHAGIYSSKYGSILDAIPSSSSEHFAGGVRVSNWNYWEKHYSDFVILRFKHLSDAKKKQVESYALSKLHEPYKLLTYKKSETSGWYCSKLIYMAYLSAGIDLDRKKAITIFPDDLALGFQSDAVFCLNDGKI
jgi:uncharacterized protein YycO